jgi:hypothetical protein
MGLLIKKIALQGYLYIMDYFTTYLKPTLLPTTLIASSNFTLLLLFQIPPFFTIQPPLLSTSLRP